MKNQPLYRLHRRQQEAMRLLGLTRNWRTAPQPVEELLYGGQAGGGKSHLLRAIGVTLCAIWPGARIPIFRRTFPELSDSHISWIQREIPQQLAVYHVGQHELRFRNGSVLMFRHADDERSVFSYLTAEWAALLIDQVEQFPEESIRFLRTRVRQPVNAFGGGWRRVIVYSANPGGPSHTYLRDGWVDVVEAPRTAIAPQEDGGMRRCFLPARLSDNPSLNREQYRQQLRGLPAHLVAAYLEGDWSVVTGAYFRQWRARTVDGAPWHVWPEAFARERYGVPANEPFPPKDWMRWGAVDFGVRDPWCTLFAARAPDRRLFLYRELYGPDVEVDMQARRIRLILQEHEERLAVLLGDPAGFAMRANLTVSDAQVYRREGVTVTRATNKREQGWKRVSEVLSTLLDDGYPQLAVLEGTCPNLVRTLPLLLVDKRHHEDISPDHGRADPASATSIRDDACLVAGTLVQTEHGEWPIEQVRAGMRVWTRQGLRRVLGAGMTAESAPVTRYTFADGRELTATPSHRVLVASGAFARLDTLRSLDTIPAWKSVSRLWSTRGFSFGGIPIHRGEPTGNITVPQQTIEKLVWGIFTRKYIRIPTALFLLGIMSTIKTTTLQTTTQPIWKQFLAQSILLITQSSGSLLRRLWDKTLLVPGTHRPLVGRGIVLTPNERGRRENLRPMPVNSAVSHIKPKTEACIASVLMRVNLRSVAHKSLILSSVFVRSVVRRLSAINTTPPKHVLVSAVGVSATQPAGQQPVYNLTVEHDPEFFANGILVHNCDALRYLVQPFVAPEQDTEPKVIESRMGGDERPAPPSDNYELPSNLTGYTSQW